MGRVFTIVFVFFAAWAGYWFVGSTLMRDAIEEWFEARQADGWVAEYSSLGVAGFPSRFDATFDALELADPPEGWAWQGDAFQILSLAYNRSSVILAFPGEHRLATPRGALTMEGAPVRASLGLGADDAVVRFVGEGDGLRLSGEFGQADVTRLVLATEAQGSASVQRLGLDATGTALDDVLRASVDPTGLLPPVIETMRLDAVARFVEAPSLEALTREPPAMEAIDIADLSIFWGELSLRAQGELTADAEGFAEGSLQVRARNWREMLRLAVAGGLIGEGAAAGLEFGLQLLAQASGGTDSLDARVIFADGLARIGPLTLGPAPRLSLP